MTEQQAAEAERQEYPLDERLADGLTPAEWAERVRREFIEQEPLYRALAEDASKEPKRPVVAEEGMVDDLSYFLMWVGLGVAFAFALLGSLAAAYEVGLYAAIVRLFALLIGWLSRPRTGLPRR